MATTAISATWAKTPSIHATLDQTEIPFGDSAQLTVTVNGRSADEPDPPVVPGLSFNRVGQSSQIQVINGAMSATVAHTYLVTPGHPGTFTIPPFKSGGGADDVNSNPLVLKVLKRSGAGPASPDAYSGRTLPAPSVSGTGEPPSTPRRNEIGVLHVVLPKKESYVGEMVPVELKACFRAGVELRVDGPPLLNSDAFTMNKLGTPARSQELIDGEPFNVFTWPTAITAVKAGDHEMTVELPTTVTVRQRPARPRSPFGDSFFDDAFDDPFFNQFFGAATQKQVRLSSAGAGVRILSLPTEGRPDSFAGAVGTFQFSATATPSRLAAGDPVTLKFEVTGRGNFDRVSAPSPESGDEWKVYSPSARFEAEDSAGYEGAKTFELALVPKQSGKREIPATEFSYFDPDQRRYVSRSTPPISIDVAPGAEDSAPVAKAGVHGADSPDDGASTTPAGLADNQPMPGTFTRSLRPWFLNPWLAGLALSPLPACLAILVWIGRRERWNRDPARVRARAAEAALRDARAVMAIAVQRGETADFFQAARSAIQQRLGQQWNLPPATITPTEVNTRMNGEADGFRILFELADEVNYTGRTLERDELNGWFKTVNAELDKLEARCKHG